MTANAFDTLKAAKSLRAAGFDEAQAEAVVSTVDDAVRAHTEPLASGLAEIADTMATKEGLAAVNGKFEAVNGKFEAAEGKLDTVEGDLEIVKHDLETVKDKVETISETMATKDYVDAALARHRAEIAVDFRNLYRHLWVMGTGFVGVTVALVKLLP